MEKKEVLKTVKQVVTLIVTAGVGAIIGNAIRHTSPPDMSLIKKAAVGVGSVVLTGMVSDAATDYTENAIDTTVQEVKEMFQSSEEESDMEEVPVEA